MSAAVAATGAPIRVLLVGTQLVSLAGLRALIDHEAGLAVVGQREHPTDTVAAPRSVTADVALIDHDAHDAMEPLTAMAQAGTGHPPMIVLTSATDASLPAQVFRAGARGLVFKHQSPDVLMDAIASVHAGEVWLDRSTTTRLVADLLGSGPGPPRATGRVLSARDHRIIALVADGQTNQQVAAALCVSDATIRNRLTAIFKTLRVTGRLQLVVYAVQQGLVTLPRDGARRNAESVLKLV